MRPLGFSKWKRFTKFEVSSSSSFEDMFDCMPKIERSRDLGHAPVGENYWRAHVAFPSGSCTVSKVSSSSSFDDRFDCMPVLVTTKNLETLTPICLFTTQLSGSYDDD